MSSITSQEGFARDDVDTALLSLRLALKAYFSTYKSAKHTVNILLQSGLKMSKEEIDQTLSHEYMISCYEAILHLHHFVELVCKNILRNIHPLLADFTSSRHHLVLYKLVKGEPLSKNEENKLRSIEFGEALDRLITLLKEGKIDSRWKFFEDNRQWLEEDLNYLRNRMVHRGTYVIRYNALDELFGRYILPFVSNVVAMGEYSHRENIWKYLPLECGIDPITAIIDEFRKEKYDIAKIAVLKELGRAAYERPKCGHFVKGECEHLERRSALLAELEQSAMGVEVRECPVCGVKSLVVYHEIDEDVVYTYQARCMNCSLEMDRFLGNPRELGLSIEDVWYEQRLN